MHVHILGICGTFMGSLALLARDMGYQVTGSDANVYPPMSTQLQTAGITIQQGYKASHLQPAPDLVIVGNAMKRGIEAVEYMLNEGLSYTSGPQFLSEQVLQHRHVIAVAGTHGKTTTTTMLAWILQYAGIDTGFLIGGVPLIDSDDERLNHVFAHSSYLGAQTLTDDKGADKRGYFVIEADEYDSAFFDKRSKFVHYRPRTAILNNLEFDHADIFANLDAIQTQFHHMIRMIPSDGQIIMPANTPNLEDTIKKGCWTPIWRTVINKMPSEKESSQEIQASSIATLKSADGSHFSVTTLKSKGLEDQESNNERHNEHRKGEVNWSMSGEHNVNNALVAITAAYQVGVSVEKTCEALSNFAGIKRRMELIADIDMTTDKDSGSVYIYDDFAHHPTAITTTLDGAVKKSAGRRIWAIIEPRSNTMKLGIHKDTLAQSASLADQVIWYEPAGLEWGLKAVIDSALTDGKVTNKQSVMNDIQSIINYIATNIRPNDVVIIMSNGGFEGIHKRLIDKLAMA